MSSAGRRSLSLKSHPRRPAMSAAAATISESIQPVRIPSAALWAGRVLSGLAVLFLAFDAACKLLLLEVAVKTSAELGWSGDTIRTLGIIQLVCLVAYLVPRTSVLG